jgi:hypothetical protein
VPRGLLRRAEGPVVLLPVEVGPCFPWGSPVFLLVPSRPLSRLLGGGTPRAGNSIPAVQRPAGMVGVTGFERACHLPAVPSMTSLPTSDRHCFLDCGRSDQAATSLRTEDHSALRVPAVPRVCKVVRGGRVFFCLSAVGPGFPWGSLRFLLVPSSRLLRARGSGTPNAGCGILAGQRPVALVGVTGFEPAASSSRTTSRGVANGR